jgi:DNA-binding transcriptional regulator YhcF (GntR family)
MKEKFKQIQNKYPDLSSIMCFVKLVKGKRFTDFQLRKEFENLVERSDYQGTSKEEIIRWLKDEIIKNKK